MRQMKSVASPQAPATSRVPSGVNARHPMPCGPMTDPAAFSASSWPGARSDRVVRSRATSAGFATRRRRTTSPLALAIRLASGENATSLTPCSCSFSRNSRRLLRKSHNATSPPCSPQSNFVPSDENANDPTPPSRFPGATICLTCWPVRTSKITTRGLGALASAAAMSRPSGENAIAMMKLCVRRSSVPIRSKARGGKIGLAKSVLDGPLSS